MEYIVKGVEYAEKIGDKELVLELQTIIKNMEAN